MIFEPTEIKGLFVIKPKIFGDNRGYFCETFRYDLFSKNVKEINFIQDNESKSSYGVLRGLHFQIPPFAQSKLVRVIEGEVLDVAVDIRPESETFGKHFAITLSGENKNQLFIPKGFAHGFIVLSKYAIFSYKVDELYSPKHDFGINAFDLNLNIDWKIPIDKILRSEKDNSLPNLEDILDIISNLKDSIG